jgi:hypothetical protein
MDTATDTKAMAEAPHGNRKAMAEDILSHGAALDALRVPWDGLYQVLADIVHPRRGLLAGTHGAARSRMTGPDQSRGREAFDGTAMRSNRTLANGQAARITPMGARWFALRPPEELAESPAAVAWYQKCGEILARKLQGSNFYNRAHEHYLDRGAFGTAATEVLPGRNGKGLHFRSLAVGSFSIGNDDKDEVDTITRVFPLDAKQLVQKYGRERLPESVLKKLADPKESLTPHFVRHTIRPRLDRDPRRSDAGNMAWESVHVLVSEKHVLAEEGYNEFPVAVSRWEMWGDSPYGRPTG